MQFLPFTRGDYKRCLKYYLLAHIEYLTQEYCLEHQWETDVDCAILPRAARASSTREIPLGKHEEARRVKVMDDAWAQDMSPGRRYPVH